METILKVLVGSHAHGLATPESDYDYRGVFIHPTSEILKLGGNTQTTSWQEGKIDDTSWELGHFLHLATKCNPTILEVFLSPIEESNLYGKQLREMFPYVWNSRDVMNAFIGYGLNQRKKFLDEKDGRPHKFAAAYARSLCNGLELLKTGTFNVHIQDQQIHDTIRRFKTGEYDSVGEVVDFCMKLQKEIEQAYKDNPNKQTNMEAVNEFLLKVRKENW